MEYKTSTLGEVCVFFSGSGFPKKYQGNKEGEYPFYKVSDISRTIQQGNTILNRAENYVNSDVIQAIKGNILPENTVVFAKIGEALKLNRRALTCKPCLVDNNVMGVKPKQEILLTEYFFYFMKNIDMGKFSESTAVPSVRKSRLEKIKINIPSLDEQKKILNILNSLNKILKSKQEILLKLDTLIKARFVEMFGDPCCNQLNWKCKKLNEITSKIGSGATPKGGKESYVVKGVSFVRSLNVYDGNFVYKNLAHLTQEQASQLQNVTLKKDDVLINITGASVARSCIVPNDILPARVNQHVSILRPNLENVNPVFLNQLLISYNFKNKLLNLGSAGGATRQAITKQQLEDLEIILPPVELQNQFALFVQQVDKSKVA